MFSSMTARVSTNTYCLARTRRLSRRSENSVGRVTHEREAPADTVQLVYFYTFSYNHLYIILTPWSAGINNKYDTK